MKDEINIPVLKVENIVSANRRRENYSIKRDNQAREFNEAIALRLEKEENLDNDKDEDKETKK
jgi:hypothetical protein